MKRYFFAYVRNFGFHGIRLYFFKALYKITRKNRFIEKKNKIIYNTICDITFNNEINSDINNEKKVFSLWWDGVDNAPILVRKCLESLTRIKDRKVIVLDKNNYSKYVNLDPIIIRKFNQKKISLVHLTDIIRFYLLSHYNCYWIDATVFITKPISLDLEQVSTLKQNPDSNYISKNRWTGFFMCHSAYFSIAYSLVVGYWKKYNILIDYFLIDFIILYLYNNYVEFKKFIDENAKFYELYYVDNNRNMIIDENEVEYIINNYVINKLSWKKELIFYKNNESTLINLLLSKGKEIND